ncbi:MAG: hypothetical protein GXO42_01490 [bacterium]|nr:hypothetical protein [bacterium]
MKKKILLLVACIALLVLYLHWKHAAGSTASKLSLPVIDPAVFAYIKYFCLHQHLCHWEVLQGKVFTSTPALLVLYSGKYALLFCNSTCRPEPGIYLRCLLHNLCIAAFYPLPKLPKLNLQGDYPEVLLSTVQHMQYIDYHGGCYVLCYAYSPNLLKLVFYCKQPTAAEKYYLQFYSLLGYKLVERYGTGSRHVLLLEQGLNKSSQA